MVENKRKPPTSDSEDDISEDEKIDKLKARPVAYPQFVQRAAQEELLWREKKVLDHSEPWENNNYECQIVTDKLKELGPYICGQGLCDRVHLESRPPSLLSD